MSHIAFDLIAVRGIQALCLVTLWTIEMYLITDKPIIVFIYQNLISDPVNNVCNLCPAFLPSRPRSED